MRKISVDANFLQRLLEESYDAGWHGSLELKEITVRELVKQAMNHLSEPIDTTFVIESNDAIQMLNESIIITSDSSILFNM
jgi:hypothetical protein